MILLPLIGVLGGAVTLLVYETVGSLILIVIVYRRINELKNNNDMPDFAKTRGDICD
jgi:hypothetical protein